MTTQVYYRRWRPRRWADVVGQEPVVRTLKQAIARGRISHAYLFCGPRGTGKTSTARILAKAVNCQNPQDGEPCDACHMCTALNEGRALDLVEIDAASNRGIDEIREIREKVRYVPAEAKYKVYVLDEAHMLTDAAADALLKTLEEPPAHAIFVLATTEAHKLPSTVVSRCQRFDFHRIALPATVERLAKICAAEGVEADTAALQLLARNAEGSLRDAENMLEQAVTALGSPLALEPVRTLLELASPDNVRTLVGHILHRRIAQALIMLNALSTEGMDLRQLHRQVVDEMRELLLLKAGSRELVAQPDEVVKEQNVLIGPVPMERLVQTLKLMGQVHFRHETPGALPLELAIIEASQLVEAAAEDVQAIAAPLDARRAAPAPRIARPAPVSAPPQTPSPAVARRPIPNPPAADAAASAPKRPPVAQAPPLDADPAMPSTAAAQEKPRTEATSAPGTSARRDQEWDGIIKTLSRQKARRFNLGALLRACRQRRIEGNVLHLEFTHRSHMERMKEELENPESRHNFIETIAKALSTPTSLELVLTAPDGQEGSDKTSQSPLVQAALGMGGKILEQTEENHE